MSKPFLHSVGKRKLLAFQHWLEGGKISLAVNIPHHFYVVVSNFQLSLLRWLFCCCKIEYNDNKTEYYWQEIRTGTVCVVKGAGCSFYGVFKILKKMVLPMLTEGLKCAMMAMLFQIIMPYELIYLL